MPEMPPADSTSVTPPANVPPSASLNSSPPPQQETRPTTLEKVSTSPARGSNVTDGAATPPPFASSPPSPAAKTFDLALIFRVRLEVLVPLFFKRQIGRAHV